MGVWARKVMNHEIGAGAHLPPLYPRLLPLFFFFFFSAIDVRTPAASRLPLRGGEGKPCVGGRADTVGRPRRMKGGGAVMMSGIYSLASFPSIATDMRPASDDLPAKKRTLAGAEQAKWTGVQGAVLDGGALRGCYSFGQGTIHHPLRSAVSSPQARLAKAALLLLPLHR